MNTKHDSARLHVLAALLAAACALLLSGAFTPAMAATSDAHGRSHDQAQGHTSSAGEASSHSQGNAGTSGDVSQPQPVSRADSNTGGANGQCPGGAYCSTRQGLPSGNGNGRGRAVGKPCAGCVGRADNKNPRGQRPNGSDRNAGYECDRNHGIGRTNPAHTGCTTTAAQDCSTNPTQAGCETRPPATCEDDGNCSPSTCVDDATTPTDECASTAPPVHRGGGNQPPGENAGPPATTGVFPTSIVSAPVAGEAPAPLSARAAAGASTAAGAPAAAGASSGTLPNTGGPDLLAAQLGAALLVIGGGLLLASRRMSRRRAMPR